MIPVTRFNPIIAPDRDPPFLDVVYMYKAVDGEYVSYEDYVQLYNKCIEKRLQFQDDDTYNELENM